MKHRMAWIATVGLVTAVVLANTGCSRLSRAAAINRIDGDAGASASPALLPDRLAPYPSQEVQGP